ncbi:MAG: hypothetical protein SPL54_03335, partial [Lachnospiraceae bacterium]|nr:hypothetical protein [Lachnospiraceae bacterium]
CPASLNSDIQLSKFAPSHPRDGFVLMSFYAIAASTLWIQTLACIKNQYLVYYKKPISALQTSMEAAFRNKYKANRPLL